jgi:hypothetical protein
MSNEIPTASRLIVSARDNGQCVRCGGRGSEQHHRRRRRVKDAHTHAACNLITLCSTCHPWVHAYPRQARTYGWIVSAHDDPHDIPVETFIYHWVLLNHDGTLHMVGQCEECGQIRLLDGGLCVDCLRIEVCHSTAHAAAAALCDCGGSAAEGIRRIRERMEEREAM